MKTASIALSTALVALLAACGVDTGEHTAPAPPEPLTSSADEAGVVDPSVVILDAPDHVGGPCGFRCAYEGVRVTSCWIWCEAPGASPSSSSGGAGASADHDGTGTNGAGASPSGSGVSGAGAPGGGGSGTCGTPH